MLGAHGYWWQDRKADFVIRRSPAGATTEDLLLALQAGFDFFDLRGERLRKPLAYVLTEDGRGRSMVSRQRSRRESVLSPDPDYALLRARLRRYAPPDMEPASIADLIPATVIW